MFKKKRFQKMQAEKKGFEKKTFDFEDPEMMIAVGNEDNKEEKKLPGRVDR